MYTEFHEFHVMLHGGGLSIFLKGGGG